MRSRPLEERILVARAFAAEVVPLLAARTVAAVIDSRFPVTDLAAAHERLASNATFGKVVIEM
jgi:NADPH:quinone reductase-like Zn-dependent oxidoreductase